jgi:hypothetical protein
MTQTMEGTRGVNGRLGPSAENCMPPAIADDRAAGCSIAARSTKSFMEVVRSQASRAKEPTGCL